MKDEYENQIIIFSKIVKLLDRSIKTSQSILENSEVPLIDRGYFNHIFNISHVLWNIVFDIIEELENLKELSEPERGKFLLTNYSAELNK